MPRLMLLLSLVLSGCQVTPYWISTDLNTCWFEGYYVGERVHAWEYILHPDYYQLWWPREWWWREFDRLETSRVIEVHRVEPYHDRAPPPASQESSTQCSAATPCKQFKVR